MSKINATANRQRRYELRVAKKHEKTIKRVYVQLAYDIESHFSKGIKDDITKIVSTKFKNNMQLALFKIAKLNIDEFINFFLKTFKRTINLNELQEIKSKLLDKFLNKYTAKTVKNVTKTTIKILNDRISKLVSEGYSQKDIVKEIVRVTKGEIGERRAKIIARVESSKAFQMTNYETAIKAGLKYKTWWYIGGGKENRKYHQEINGKKIPIKDKFDVSGENGVPPPLFSTL